MGSSIFHPCLSLTLSLSLSFSLSIVSIFLSLSLNVWFWLQLSFVNYDMLLSLLSVGKDWTYPQMEAWSWAKWSREKQTQSKRKRDEGYGKSYIRSPFYIYLSLKKAMFVQKAMPSWFLLKTWTHTQHSDQEWYLHWGKYGSVFIVSDSPLCSLKAKVINLNLTGKKVFILYA